MKINSIEGFEVIDSRGNPPVGAKVSLEDDSFGIAYARRVPRTSAGARIGPWQSVRSSGSLLAEPICCRRVLQRRQRPDGIFVRR